MRGVSPSSRYIMLTMVRVWGESDLEVDRIGKWMRAPELNNIQIASRWPCVFRHRHIEDDNGSKELVDAWVWVEGRGIEAVSSTHRPMSMYHGYFLGGE